MPKKTYLQPLMLLLLTMYFVHKASGPLHNTFFRFECFPLHHINISQQINNKNHKYEDGIEDKKCIITAKTTPPNETMQRAKPASLKIRSIWLQEAESCRHWNSPAD